MDRRVLVESLVNHKVGLAIQGYNFFRMFEKEGAKAHIPFEILFDGLSEPGVDTLFKDGLLKIVNPQDAIDLGMVSEEEIMEKEEKKVVETLTENQIIKLLKIDSVDKFKETMETLLPEQRTKVAEVAIAKEAGSLEKFKLIEDYTDIDVISIVNENKKQKEN